MHPVAAPTIERLRADATIAAGDSVVAVATGLKDLDRSTSGPASPRGGEGSFDDVIRFMRKICAFDPTEPASLSTREA